MTTPTTQSVSAQIAEELRAHLARAKQSRRGLAKQLEVDPMWVSRRLSGQQVFTVEDVVRICDALEIPALPILSIALDSTPELEPSP